MQLSKILQHVTLFVLSAAIFIGIDPAKASDPDPAVMSYLLPSQIKWKGNQAVLYGDPEKPGFYVVLTKWEPNHMSRPHFHQHDRYIYVVSGTWWLGWGKKYDPDSTFPVTAGSFVHHYAKQVHYDGAKNEGCVLEIMGEGPAKPTPAEEK